MTVDPASLVLRQWPEGTVVYNLRSHATHLLNPEVGAWLATMASGQAGHPADGQVPGGASPWQPEWIEDLVAAGLLTRPVP